MNRIKAIAADGIALGTFALLARIAHRSPGEPLTFANWADTVWPFLLGGLVGWGLARGTGASLGRGVIVWAPTVLVGLGIWGVRHQAIPHWSFVIVASVMSALLMFGWRAVAAASAKSAAKAS